VQQNGGVVTPHVALGFGLQGNFIATSFSIGVILPPTLPSLNGGGTPLSSISSLKLLCPPLSLALHRHPTMQAPKTLKVEGSSSKKIVASTMKSCTILQATTPYPFVTKDIIKHMHNFLVVEQKVFLGMKEHLKETIVEKLQKEVEHWRAQLMFDD
jgi:hypothetical protein